MKRHSGFGSTPAKSHSEREHQGHRERHDRERMVAGLRVAPAVKKAFSL